MSKTKEMAKQHHKHLQRPGGDKCICHQYRHTARNRACQKRREHGRVEEENRKREEAKQRCLQRIMMMIQQEREARNIDDVPPCPEVALQTAGQRHDADMHEMKEEFEKMQRGEGGLSVENVGRLDFILATARTQTEVEVGNADETRFQILRRQT